MLRQKRVCASLVQTERSVSAGTTASSAKTRALSQRALCAYFKMSTNHITGRDAIPIYSTLAHHTLAAVSLLSSSIP